MRCIPVIIAGLALLGGPNGSADAYTIKQRSYRAAGGTVTFACVTAPFEGTISFVPSERFRSGIAAIVVPSSNYQHFLHRRYPTPWYAAAVIDSASGTTTTPAIRQFERETQKVPTIMFQAEGDRYGNYDRPHLPLDADTLDVSYAQVEAAIANCRLRH